MTDRVSLRDLDARLIASTGEGFRDVDTVDEAQGVIFLCPKCYVAHGGSIGTHAVICWSPKAPASIPPGPARWTITGTSLDDLSLSPSIQLTSGCMWHGFVTNGEALL